MTKDNLTVGFQFIGEKEKPVHVDKYIDCCGIREISGLSYHRGPRTAMKAFCSVYPESKSPNNPYSSNDSAFRYAVFSQINQAKYGERFAAYIRDNKLGDVIETTGKHVNPNSGNVLKVFVWTVDHTAVKQWLKKEMGTDAKTAAKEAKAKAESQGPRQAG